MKQRLGVAQALINAPRLLLLDEPTSALDPIGRREVLEMIAALAGRTTVFFSTHILADVERVCDTVAVLAGGRVVEQAGIDELKARHGGAHRVVIEVDDPRRLQEALRRRGLGRRGHARRPRAPGGGRRPRGRLPARTGAGRRGSASPCAGSRPTRSRSKTSSSTSSRGRSRERTQHARLRRVRRQGDAGDAQDVAALGAARRARVPRTHDARSWRRSPRRSSRRRPSASPASSSTSRRRRPSTPTSSSWATSRSSRCWW